MGHAVALPAILPADALSSFAKVADFALKFDEAVIPFARERAGGERGEHGAIFLFGVGAIAEMAAWRERLDFGKRFFRAFICRPDVELPHAGRVNDHAALGQKNHLAPRGRVAAFGVLLAHFHGRHQVFAVKPVDEARFANARSADEHDGVAGFDEGRQFLHAATGERADRQHQHIARHARGLRQLGVKVLAQINFVEDDHWTRAAFVRHDQHSFQSRGVERRIGGGDEKNRFNIGGEDLLGGVAAGHLAGHLGAARQDGLDRGLLLVGHELHGDPIADLRESGVITARFVNEFASDLRGEFRVNGPDAIEMFVLHRDARRDETLGKVRRELLVALRIPAQLGQAHKWRSD